MRRFDYAGTAHATTWTAHALQQISLVFAGFGHGEHFLTFHQAFGFDDFHFFIRINLMDSVGYCFRNTAGDRETTAVAAAGFEWQVFCFGDIIHGDALCFHHAGDFFKGKYKIHVGTDASAHCLQLFGSTRSDKGYFTSLVPFFYHTCGQNHRGQSHGNVWSEFREVLFREGGPCRTAGCRHEV